MTTGHEKTAGHTPGPWEYVPGNENHGPYVSNPWGAGDICDCYSMSNPSALSVRNGGDSRPINHQHEEADANARLIAAAPDMLEELEQQADGCSIIISMLHGQTSAVASTLAGMLRLQENSARAAIAKATGTTGEAA